ncbi:DUF1835 domain-containing protein [Paenibacillus sedimenti]|uniref:DUF1835 domain-containing protein n=1 Tax=Paenibacillus sedimenti TaxID=2770274 RepID=A0A926QLY0_9BACL|nr:DUF1835 domain-containing protein [Paenibacillus sedimenti]MBD0384115.1 DUF1835 domain-containing protein [Paenibacillus sedimenti]
MPKLLHIVNGDAFAEKLRASDIPGDILAWRESLYEGPVGLQMSDSVLLSIRAQYMETRHRIPLETFTTITLQQEKALDAIAQDIDEVVLWFEYDLYDQLMLCYLLSRFSNLSPRSYRLALLCIGEFPGVEPFYGLGQLSVEQVKQLHEKWNPVADEQLSLANRVWTAYSASEPLAMANILKENLSALSFLPKALQTNMERFPSVQNGLSGIQQLVLELIRHNDMTVLELFKQVSQISRGYGLGDLQFWGILDSVRLCKVPLVTLIGGNQLPGHGEKLPDDFAKWRLQLTENGRRVLDYELDYVQLNGVDEWIGGVHLLGKEGIWRKNLMTMQVCRL